MKSAPSLRPARRAVRAERQAWAATHIGRVRPLNEDRCVVGDWRSHADNETWQGHLPAEKPWALLADGMGGHEAGEVASQIALDTVAHGLAKVRTEADIAHLLDAANLKVFEAMYGGGGRPAMGTTIVGAVQVARRTLIFNLGDSRAYSFAGGELAQLSRDHSLGADGSSRRRSPLLTQSLGGTVSRRPLLPSMTWLDANVASTLLLCSDGLTDTVEDEEIAALLKRHPSEPAAALVEAALDAGGTDNITVIVLGEFA